MTRCKEMFILFFIGSIMVIVLSGCWSSQELNEMSIVSSLGLDKQEDKYRVTVQVINPGEIAEKEGGEEARTSITTYQGVGSTLFEAVRRLTTKVPKKIYAAHLRTVVIGEELAKKDGINKVLEFLIRDHEFRTDFYFLIAKNTTAKSILDILTPMEKIPAQKMFFSLETSHEHFSSTVTVTIDQLITDLVTKKKNPVITGVQISGDPEAGTSKTNAESIPALTQFEFSEVAAFKKDKLIGWLNERESQGYNFIMDDIVNPTIDTSCPNAEKEKIALELTRSSTELKGNVHNNQPRIEINVQAEGNLGEVMCGIDVKKENMLNQIEKLAEEKIKSLMQSSIQTAQNDFRSDIFGFGEVIHREDPKAWKLLQKNWEQEFSDLPVDVKVTFNIRKTGTVGNPFLKNLEEE
ncbi:Ger(x)C family spore germination protein [Alteribacillus bidgolensis]|uniref:Spore germination protein KC n=1 Tax=Alteribacillus bidgolensis TaxID=930129 RepID=A0A1G8H6R0_9BACI|nr:Ger(x)C family spore germination protein [Alteribacillus bidgolensis]SDI02338.1 spore germination protein KC [Alteribacillus bidgolensis]